VITLALDTSTGGVAVAVLNDDHVLVSGSVVADRGQGEQLAPTIERVLKDAGVSRADRIVVGVGPGPFTGLRVGLVTADVLALVWQAPLIGVCSLDALARQAREERPDMSVLVATDARRSEVYWARYDATGVRTHGPEVGFADVAAQALGDGWAVGEGAGRYVESFNAVGVEVGGPEFIDAAQLVLALNAQPDIALPPRPLYLRRPDAVEPSARKLVGR